MGHQWPEQTTPTEPEDPNFQWIFGELVNQTKPGRENPMQPVTRSERPKTQPFRVVADSGRRTLFSAT